MAAIAGRSGGFTSAGQAKRPSRQQKLARKAISPAVSAYTGVTINQKAVKPLRVLIAEDEERIRNRAALQLMKSGMRVKKIGAPGRLDIVLDAFKPDVLILDDHFEGSDTGFTSIIPNVIGRHPKTRVLVTTRQPETDLAPGQRPSAWGATGVLEKAKMFVKRGTLERAVRKVVHD